MIFKKISSTTVFIALIVLLLSNCVPEQKKVTDPSIRIREASIPASINPFYIRDEVGFYIAGQIFQPLLAIDYETEELVGVLAKERPKITSTKEWKMIIEYQLRENAQFSDGSSLNYKDILYSIKANICPILNPYYNNYYQFIDSIAVDPSDSNRFTIYSNETYYLSEFTSGDYYILSERQFDPNRHLRSYSLDQLKALKLQEEDTLLASYSKFIQEFTFRDSILPIGSGAYDLTSWQNDDRLSLSQKKNWWGNAYSESNTYFKANAEQLEFYFIEEDNSALNALKNGDFDLMRGIASKDYKALKSNENFNAKFDLHEASKFGFQYLGFNWSNEHLQYLPLRKAIAYAIPQEKIIENVFYGLAENAVSIDRETEQSNSYDFLSYELNLDSALYFAKLYKSENNVEKIKLTYAYNAGNDSRKAIGLILKQSLEQLGIEIEIVQYEWSVYLQKLKAGDFDLFMNGLLTSSITPDLTNTFHSNAINGGRNYFHYKDSISDQLLDSITLELNEKKRNKYFQQLEYRINRQIPLLTLMRPMEIMAFSKELENTKSYRLRPNYWAAEISKE